MITYWNIFTKTIKDILFASVFFAIAAFLNASMDITIHNFNGSVYSKIAEPGTPIYKYFESDWRNKWVLDENGEPKLDESGKRIPNWFLDIHIIPLNHPLFFDSWHLFKAAMIFFFIITLIVFYFKATKIIFKLNDWKYWGILAIVLLWFFIEWNLVFNLFYDTILRI